MRIFGSLESQIMPIMWRRETATVKQVHRKIVDWRDIAYTTVITTMERLAEKGVLTREKRGLRLHARTQPRGIRRASRAADY
jgi:predicted transcriptional regulator